MPWPCPQPGGPFFNPERIGALSPGLRVGELPWECPPQGFANPEGVEAHVAWCDGLGKSNACCNPFRVEENSFRANPG